MKQELAWQIGETSLALKRFYDRRAQEVGVTRAQWKVLLRLGREPGLKQVELAERMDIEPITLCRIVDRLEDSGLVTRQRDPDDRRAWRLELTEKAQPVLTRLRALAVEMSTEAFDGFDEADVAMLTSLLTRIRENTAGMEAGRKASA